MKKVVIWGITYEADLAFRSLKEKYKIIGFFDHDKYKQGKIYQNLPVLDKDILLRQAEDIQIIIAVPHAAAQIEKQCMDWGLSVLGIYMEDQLMAYRPLHFKDLKSKEKICLYAGDIPMNDYYDDDSLLGLSICKADNRHIYHDISQPYPLPDNCIDGYIAEDVLEHLPYDKLVSVMNEIYRILKPGGLFRLALPDYRCDIMDRQSLKNRQGEILFDPNGGGSFKDGIIGNGGHLRFPKYESVKALIEKCNFQKFHFLHYYDEKGNSMTHPIDYSKGHISRTPDFFDCVKSPYRALSIVVDLYK